MILLLQYYGQHRKSRSNTSVFISDDTSTMESYTSPGPTNSQMFLQVQIPQHTSLLSQPTSLVTPNSILLPHFQSENGEGSIETKPQNKEEDDDDELLFDIDEFLEEEESLIHRSSSTISEDTEEPAIGAESPAVSKDTRSISSVEVVKESKRNNTVNPTPATTRKKKRKRSRKSKNNVDKDAPKRPLSAYNLYFREERKRCLAQTNATSSPDNKKYNFEELGKLIGKGWRALPLKEKRVLETRAETDRERYRNEMIAYKLEKRRKLQEEDDNSLIVTQYQIHQHDNACPRSPTLSMVSQTAQGHLAQSFHQHQDYQQGHPPPTYSPKQPAAHNTMVQPHMTDLPGPLAYLDQRHQRRYPQEKPHLYHEDATATAADPAGKSQHVRRVSVSIMTPPHLGDNDYRSKNNASPSVSSYGSCSSWSGGEYEDNNNNDQRNRKRKHRKQENNNYDRKGRKSAGSQARAADRATPTYSSTTTNTTLLTRPVENPQTPSGTLVESGATPHKSPCASPNGVAVARVVGMPPTDGLQRMLRDGRQLEARSPHPPHQHQHHPHQSLPPPPPPPSPQYPWVSHPHSQHAYGPPLHVPPHYQHHPQPYPPPPSSPVASDQRAYALVPPPSEAFAVPPYSPRAPPQPTAQPPQPLSPPQMLPVGMQILLRDPATGQEHSYRIQYTPKYMTVEQANQFQRTYSSRTKQEPRQIPQQQAGLAIAQA